MMRDLLIKKTLILAKLQNVLHLLIIMLIVLKWYFTVVWTTCNSDSLNAEINTTKMYSTYAHVSHHQTQWLSLGLPHLFLALLELASPLKRKIKTMLLM